MHVGGVTVSVVLVCSQGVHDEIMSQQQPILSLIYKAEQLTENYQEELTPEQVTELTGQSVVLKAALDKVSFCGWFIIAVVVFLSPLFDIACGKIRSPSWEKASFSLCKLFSPCQIVFLPVPLLTLSQRCAQVWMLRHSQRVLLSNITLLCVSSAYKKEKKNSMKQQRVQVTL